MKQIPALKLEIKAKQDILMPNKSGYHVPGQCVVLAKGTTFKWVPRTRSYVAKLNGSIVASVSQQYVDKVNIFE